MSDEIIAKICQNINLDSHFIKILTSLYVSFNPSINLFALISAHL